jgi:hypothetical protein
MFITGKHLIDFEPGCGSAWNRSTGLFLFRFACLAILMTYTPERAASAWHETRASIVPAYVGSVVTEEFVLENAPNSTGAWKPIVTPAGSAEVHVTQQPLQQKVRVILRIRFLRHGRCSIRLPVEWFSGQVDAPRAIVRLYDVRPWPVRDIVTRDSVRAGVGPLAADLAVSNGSEETVAGEGVVFRLRLTGAAAMAVEQPPDLSIVEAEPIGTGAVMIDRPLVVASIVDWGDTTGRPMTRAWQYEWRAGEPGAYRIRPLRITHLDYSGQVQTRLVTGLKFEVRPRALFRAGGESNDRSMTNRAGAHKKWVVRDLAGGMLFAVLAAITAFFAWSWSRRQRLARSLRRKLRGATSPEMALAAWRSIEPVWRDCSSRVKANSVKDYEELRRRAFGPPPSDS